MGKPVAAVLKDALQLSDSDRAQLVDELLTTLETEKNDDVDAAWAQEVEKRASDLSQGTVVPVIWNEVKEKAYRKVQGKN